MEGYSFVELFGDALPGSAVARVEGGVVAERASSQSDGPVAVGAGEPGVDHQFLQPLAVALPQERGEREVSFSFGEVHA